MSNQSQFIMKLKFLLSILMVVGVVFMSGSVLAQGITTSSITGYVNDQNGEGLPGANVLAVHVPSGTRYVTSTLMDGKYTIPGMRVGGPYTVTVSYIGYEPQVKENITLSLGVAANVSFRMLDEGTLLQEVVVSGKQDATFSSDRTGAATNIDSERINSLPTLSRSISDYARLTPQANTRAGGISFAGANNRYNQFAIDGTVNNDVFGLAASGTNGGQTGTQPISLDAIQEISVELAPFDVRMGGFTGGGINAITRSGSNSFEGSAYYFVNNQNLTGKGVIPGSSTEGEKVTDYSERQYGFRLGGPIIKDKLFFFVNGELTERTQPKLFGLGEGSNITQSEIDQVLSVIERIAPGADVGDASPFNEVDETQKVFARIDWSINDRHKFSIRHNYVNSESLSIFRNANTFVLSGGALFFPSKTNTTVAELSSRFSNTISNELRVGFTSVRDNRTYQNDPFPFVRVDLDGGRSIQLGSEQFSTVNRLFQDVLTITDNLTFYKGKHILTVGTHNEFYQIENAFIRQAFGSYRYESLEDWLTVGTANEAFPVSYDYSFSNVPNEPNWAASFGAAQLGFYAQDEYQANDKLKLTFGIRADIPLLNDEPTANPDFNNSDIARENGLATNQVASGNLLWSPRVGFNYDVNGDRSLQVRGGAGIFTGRMPFVWLSNQYSNTGIQIGRLQAQSRFNEFPDGFQFNPNPNTQPDAEDLGLSTFTSEINVLDPDFKYPQIFRANLGLDYNFGDGFVFTFDGIYSKNINNILYQNYNVSGLEDGTATTLPGVDNRPRFGGSFINSGYTDIIYLTNTNKGHTANFTGQISKTFVGGLYANVGYTYGISKDINPGTSSQAISNWRGVPTYTNPNDPELSFSNFMVPHRIVAALTYRKEYLGNLATSIGLFYSGQSGSPISFTYNGDVNRDRIFGNDLVYVPANRGEIELVDVVSGGQVTKSADQQWAELDAYISNNSYLDSRRGDYAERNGAFAPFEHRFDVRIAQEVFTENAGKLEFTFDVFNAGNLLNKEWGRSYSTTGTQILTVAGTRADGTPTFRSNLSGSEPWVENDFFSRWRAQFGVRYTF